DSRKLSDALMSAADQGSSNWKDQDIFYVKTSKDDFSAAQVLESEAYQESSKDQKTSRIWSRDVVTAKQLFTQQDKKQWTDTGFDSRKLRDALMSAADQGSGNWKD